MAHDREQIAADAKAVAQGRCPETGVSLDGLDVRAHAELLWPEKTLDPRVHADAMRRRRLLIKYADDHEKAEK